MWTPEYRDVVEYDARAGPIWTPHDNLARSHEIPGMSGRCSRICWLMTQTARKPESSSGIAGTLKRGC